MDKRFDFESAKNRLRAMEAKLLAKEEMAPESLQAIFRKRSLSIAHRSKIEENDDRQRFLVVESMGERYGLELSILKEALKSVVISSMPNTTAPLLGFTNLRGSLVPIVDLAAFMGNREREVAEYTVVCRLGDTKSIGLQVAALEKILNISSAKLKVFQPKNWEQRNVKFVTEDGIFIIDSLQLRRDLASIVG